MQRQQLFNAVSPIIYTQESDQYQHRVLDVKAHKDSITAPILFDFELFSNALEDNMHRFPLVINEKNYCQDFHMAREDQARKELNELLAKYKNVTFEATRYERQIDSDCRYVKQSITYQLPTDPQAALYWLACFFFYRNEIMRNRSYLVDSVHFNPELKEVDSLKAYANWNNQKNNIQTLVTEAILAFKNANDAYYPAITLIEKIYEAYKQDRANNVQLPFVQYVLHQDLLATNLKQLAIGLVNTGKENELHIHVQRNNSWIMRKLFAQVIDKRAHDGGEYSWRYTEWDFLENAKFQVLQDGRVTICDLENNAGYTKHYAPQQRNENIFVAEMKFLMNVLGLTFDQCDPNAGMIFSKTSSEELKKLGFMFADDLIKEAKAEMKVATENHVSPNFFGFFDASNNIAANVPTTVGNHVDITSDNMNVNKFDIRFHG